MRLNEYQELAMRTCSIPQDKTFDKLVHGVTGLVSEIYEFKEALNNKTHNNLVTCCNDYTTEEKEHVIKELGDCTWMIAEICDSQGIRFEQVVAESELHKASSPESALMKLCGMVQKTYQGHVIDNDKIYDALCEITGYVVRESQCISNLNTVLETNIAKLKARFPEGFDAEKSLNRAEGDI